MCNITKLKGKMIEKGLKQSDLANKIEMDRSTLSQKIKKAENFTIGDAIKISKALDLSKYEALEIFFAEIVA